MADNEHLRILRTGVEAWNDWRESSKQVKPDLSAANLRGEILNGANLAEANLSGAVLVQAELENAILRFADLREANLAGANLRGANPNRAKLRGATLTSAILSDTNFYGADLSLSNLDRAHLDNARLDNASLHRATLRHAILCKAKFVEATISNADLSFADLSVALLHFADLSEANLTSAKLINADLYLANLERANLNKTILHGASLLETCLIGSSLIDSDFTNAKLDDSRVYGASVWDVDLEGTSQRDLVITPADQSAVTVDDLEVAQFIYLLLKNRRVRSVIDTITSKAVLILGSFAEERKAVLDALRDELRRHNFTPIMFDFGKPDSRDLTETVSVLAHLSRFVIADITDAKCIPQELAKIVPNLPSLPVRPIILDGQYEYSMFTDFSGFLSVVSLFRYRDTHHLLESLESEVIEPALAKSEEIAQRRKEF